jgi:hypothetical protein
MRAGCLLRVVKPASSLLDTWSDCLPTGVSALDVLLAGGFPRGRITEIVGFASSGKTSLLCSALTQATERNETVAYVDSFDVFDPFCAARAGVDLRRLLWIRCGGFPGKALAATDVVTRAGGFGVVVLDLIPPDAPKTSSSSPPADGQTWRRFKQTIENSRTVLFLLGRQAVAGSAATLVLSLQRREVVWRVPHSAAGRARHSVFQGLQSEILLERGKRHGSAVFHSGF